MSWFKDDAVLVDERPGESVAEGVLQERRSLLRLSAATVAAGLATSCAARLPRVAEPLPEPALAPETPATDGTLDIAGFLAEMYPRAQRFVASGGQREEAYLMAVGELMARLRTPTSQQANAAMRDFGKSHADGGRSFEMWVVMFDLEPGKGFSHHDHRDYNGVILGVDGEAHVTNYDILGDTPVPPKGETFHIRQTRNDVILPGRFSTLATTRENVHELVAGPDGAVVLDVFTYLKPGAQSYFMNVEAEPLDAERRVYEASWA